MLPDASSGFPPLPKCTDSSLLGVFLESFRNPLDSEKCHRRTLRASKFQIYPDQFDHRELKHPGNNRKSASYMRHMEKDFSSIEEKKKKSKHLIKSKMEKRLLSRFYKILMKYLHFQKTEPSTLISLVV